MPAEGSGSRRGRRAFSMTTERASKRSTTTVDACAAVLAATRPLRDLLSPEASLVDAAVAALDAWLVAHRTLIRTDRVQLVHAPDPRPEAKVSTEGVEVRRSGLHATVQLILYEDGAIRDIKEQPNRFLPADALADLPRALAFLDGWVAALQRILSPPGGPGVRSTPARFRDLDLAMPHDFFDVSVLALKTPRTAADFEAAFARRWKIA